MADRIFKIQRSIVAPGAATALVYDEHREFEGEFPLDDSLKRYMGRDLKVYVYGRIIDTKLHIDRRAPEQKW